jgi:hypothetical protein
MGLSPTTTGLVSWRSRTRALIIWLNQASLPKAVPGSARIELSTLQLQTRETGLVMNQSRDQSARLSGTCWVEWGYHRHH